MCRCRELVHSRRATSPAISARQPPFSPKRPGEDVDFSQLDPLVGPLEVAQLAFRFFASNSVALLDFADELVALSFDDRPIIIGKLAPLFFRLTPALAARLC